ncbi:LacI family DNA-binding transcriptional regulator [Pseudactinotalea sp. Z1739]|uniref:LacI family DNA-binding transcriptional regulator n=1 Tax=Pseudactinotalea sp. Z1739 TaxID=3413028 RepID=UPI003C79E19E
MRRVTIYSIADALGISASTVSRAFSRPDLVKASVREEVLAKAQELGYSPNRAARGLATGRTGVLGLLVPDITNPFFPPMVRAVQRASAHHDAEVLLIDSERSETMEEDLLRRIRPQVDGLVIVSPRLPTSRLRAMLTGIPSVVVNRAVRGLPSVVCDNTRALQQAAEHLHGLGHRRLALVRGPRRSWAAEQRAKAIREWTRPREVDLVELGPFEAQFEAGRTAAGDLVDSGATAAFAFDDLMAAGMIAGLNDRGEQVPADRSIVGCDDVLLARTMTPGLTTVSAPFVDLGRHAVDMLHLLITGAKPSTVTLHGELEVRGTVGAVRRQ